LTQQGQLLEDRIRASIQKICSVLEYNRSNLYYTTKAWRKLSRQDDEWLEKEIRAIIDMEPVYWTRRITAVLRRKQGPTINRKCVHRIVKD
jgi:hypothetical protein